MWMMPVHLHVNQKSDYDDDDDFPDKHILRHRHNFITNDPLLFISDAISRKNVLTDEIMRFIYKSKFSENVLSEKVKKFLAQISCG